jgi:hypothetical protein
MSSSCKIAERWMISRFRSSTQSLVHFTSKFQLSTLARASQTSTEDQLIVELDKAKALAQNLALSTITFKTNEFILQNCRKMDDLEFESWRL